MPTEQILAAIVAERDKLNRVIEILQGPIKRRGRPPMKAELGDLERPALRRKKRTFTAAQRRQQAEKMKAYWAKKRAQPK